MPRAHVGGVRAACSPGGREDPQRRWGRRTGEWGGGPRGNPSAPWAGLGAGLRGSRGPTGLGIPQSRWGRLGAEDSLRGAPWGGGTCKASARLFPQVNPEGAGDEDSCSSSAPLSPSSSPQSMASGSVCPPGKCVCSSCGLEIVDKYLLKVGWGSGEPRRSQREGWEGKCPSSYQPWLRRPS